MQTSFPQEKKREYFCLPCSGQHWSVTSTSQAHFLRPPIHPLSRFWLRPQEEKHSTYVYTRFTQCGEITWRTYPPLTLLFLLLLNLSRDFGRTGDSQRRLRLLDGLSEPLAWMDRRHRYMMTSSPRRGLKTSHCIKHAMVGPVYSPTVATVAVAVDKMDLPQLPQ